MSENLILPCEVTELQLIIRKELHSFFSQSRLALSEPDKDELLTIKEAAELLSLSVFTIYGLVSRSVIPYRKPNRRLYFSKKELLEWVENSKRTAKNGKEVCYE